MSKLLTESAIETFAIELFEKLGYQYIYAPDIAPDSETPERERFEDLLLFDRLRRVVARMTKHDPAEFAENPGNAIFFWSSDAGLVMKNQIESCRYFIAGHDRGWAFSSSDLLGHYSRQQANVA